MANMNNNSRRTPVLAYAYILSSQHEAVIEQIETACSFKVRRMFVRSEDHVMDVLSQLPRVYMVKPIEPCCYIRTWIREINGKWYAIYEYPPDTDTYEYIALPEWLGERVKEQAPWLTTLDTVIGYRLDEFITVILGHVAIILYTDLPLDKARELKLQAPWVKVRVIQQDGKIYNVKGSEVQEVPMCAT